MQRSKHEWRSTVAAVIALLNNLDPYGLEPGTAEGAPHDEYEAEAHSLAGLLLNTGSVSRDQVDAIWQKWFQEPLSEVVGAAKAELTQRFRRRPMTFASRSLSGAARGY